MKCTIIGLLFLLLQGKSLNVRGETTVKHDLINQFNNSRDNKRHLVTKEKCEIEEVDIIIVGAGLAGISAALRLKEINAANSGENDDLTFKVIESTNEVGGRSVAAYFYTGAENPLLEILIEEAMSNGQNPMDFYTETDFESINYYDNDGMLLDATSTGDDFEIASQCWGDSAEMYFDGTIVKDESLRESLEDCGWGEPGVGSLEEAVEWYNYDFDLTVRANKVGYLNYPLLAPPDDVGGEEYIYTKTPRNIAYIAEILARDIQDEIVFSTSVEEIDWWQETVKVYTEKENGECVRYDAGRVLVTTSIGVMDKRGDDKYQDSKPMYSPNLQKEKMSALRELYIDESRSPTSMGEYRDIRFQFGTAFWNDDPVEFISTQSPSSKLGKFRIFQNLDFEGYYEDSKALKGFLMTSDYDEVKDKLEGDQDTANALVNELLAESIGRAYPTEFFDNMGNAVYNCLQIAPGRFPDPNPPAGPNDCVWSFFGGENENWYGSYSHFEVTSGSALDAYEKFDLVFQPLTPAKDKLFGGGIIKEPSNTVWFSGAAYCDRHAEFVHGAYWAGIVSMNEMMEDWGYNIGPDDVTETEEYIFCFTGQ